MDTDSKDRRLLERTGTLHWLYGAAIVASLLLTLGTWYCAKSQADQRIKGVFDREVSRIFDLVSERIEKHEDAPLVVAKLIDGTLRKENRQVGIKITDGDDAIYDEHLASDPDFDPNPIFTRSSTLELYGRRWHFDIRTTRSFRDANTSNQAKTLLAAGLAIDTLLASLFLLISRANRRALAHAGEITAALQAKTKDLERSNAELEQFAFVASHDLQEPLRIVGSYAAMLGKKYPHVLDDKGKRYLHFLTGGAERMQTMVRDLLAYSRAETDTESVAAVNMSSVVDDTVADLALLITESGAVVTRDALPQAMTNPGQIRLVIQNLITNAIKFRHPDRAPLVKITARRDGGECTFSVADNGIGINEDYAERIFQIFQRLNSREEYEGSGLGLAICKKIVTRYGGRIWLESARGKGSTFHFTLPSAD